MALLQITVRGSDTDRARLQYVNLDGIQIGIRSRWSAYQSRWYLWLVASDGSNIAGPIKMVPATDLLAQYHHDTRVPPGVMFLDGPDNVPPDLDTIDISVRLVYREAA